MYMQFHSGDLFIYTCFNESKNTQHMNARTHACSHARTHTHTHTHTKLKHHQQMLVMKGIVPGVCGLWVLSLCHPDQRHLVTHGLLPVGAGDALPHRAGGQPHHQGLAGTTLCTPAHHTTTFSAYGLCLWVQVSKLGAGVYSHTSVITMIIAVVVHSAFGWVNSAFGGWGGGVDRWLAGVLIVSLWVSGGSLNVKSEL